MSISRRLALRLLQWLPPTVLRAAGRLQFQAPWLHRLMLSVVTPATNHEGVIRHGIGAGLRFDATGGQPGYLFGTSEPHEQAFLKQWLRTGSVFYDIGANVGFFSTLAGHLVGPEGAVYAFEPFAESADRCSRNAQLNGFRQVRVFPVAVANRAGSANLALGTGSTTHRLSSEATEGKRVNVVRLDDFVAEHALRAPDVLMMDVEGGEIEALESMHAILQRTRPVILCEVHWIGEKFWEFVEEHLLPLGYEVSTLEGISPSTPGERYHAVMSVRGRQERSPQVLDHCRTGII